MWMPSSTTSDSVSRLVPWGQMTCTSQPASRRVVLSCHTRRSNGTDRFSTRIRALPAKAQVPIVRPARVRVGEADEVNDGAIARRLEGTQHGGVLAADDAHVRVGEDVFDGVGQQVAQVRQVSVDVLAVG